MKPKLVDVKKVAQLLQAQCPFIAFAVINGIDAEGHVSLLENVELSVLLEKNTGFFYALEKILPAMTVFIPEAFCEVTLLNRVDVITRYKASNSQCLFIRNGNEQTYRKFIQQSRLDYRILKAQCRRKGINGLNPQFP
jgi:hypothetical protein